MAHNLLGTRFYNRSNKAAWHGIGINDASDHTAADVFKRIGAPVVTKVPLLAEINGQQIETGLFGMYRHPIAEDNQYRLLGNASVTKDYEPIDARVAGELYDRNILDRSGKTAPVETLGILGKGESVFITTELPSFSVKGDAMQSYLLYHNPMVPGSSVGVYTTTVRVVCQNTLMAALSGAIQRHNISHTGGAIAYLEKWLTTIYQQSLDTVDLMKQAYDVLAGQPVGDKDVKYVIDNTYPLPAMPREMDGSKRALDERMEDYEYQYDLQRRVREQTVNLFKGQGWGMSEKSCAGTAFGVWNAVAEMETYRRGDQRKAVSSLIDGQRGDRIRKAFKLSMEVAGVKTLA